MSPSEAVLASTCVPGASCAPDSAPLPSSTQHPWLLGDPCLLPAWGHPFSQRLLTRSPTGRRLSAQPLTPLYHLLPLDSESLSHSRPVQGLASASRRNCARLTGLPSLQPLFSGVWVHSCAAFTGLDVGSVCPARRACSQLGLCHGVQALSPAGPLPGPQEERWVAHGLAPLAPHRPGVFDMRRPRLDGSPVPSNSCFLAFTRLRSTWMEATGPWPRKVRLALPRPLPVVAGALPASGCTVMPRLTSRWCCVRMSGLASPPGGRTSASRAGA